MNYSELNKKEKWTITETAKMLLYCANVLKVIPSKNKINKAKKAITKINKVNQR